MAILIILAIGGVAYWQWRVSLRRWPYRPCRRCGGTSRTEGSTKQRFGRCHQCGGTGRQLRWGAHK
jgi:DnaJ-class molecular chaperone